jgi:hypothetical protein
MAKKPQAGRSKAQKRAEHKRAVSGGRAEAAKIAKFGQTKAQHKASQKWAAAGRASQAAARKGIHKKPHPILAHKLSQGNVACCAAEALAASLRLTGVRAGEDDMLGLYWQAAAGPDDGVPLQVMLDVAGQLGLAGRYPLIRPASRLIPGTILGFDDWDGLGAHAVVLAGSGAWSWGGICPLPGPPDEAWEVTWQTTRSVTGGLTPPMKCRIF